MAAVHKITILGLVVHQGWRPRKITARARTYDAEAMTTLDSATQWPKPARPSAGSRYLKTKFQKPRRSSAGVSRVLLAIRGILPRSGASSPPTTLPPVPLGLRSILSLSHHRCEAFVREDLRKRDAGITFSCAA